MSTPAKTPSFPPPAVSVTFCSDIATSKDDTGPSPRSFGFSDPETQILLLPCLQKDACYICVCFLTHHRLPRLKSHVGALHDSTLVQAETTVRMCENVRKSVQMHAGLPQTRQHSPYPPEVVVRWY